MHRVRIVMAGMALAVAVGAMDKPPVPEACPWGDLTNNPYAPVKGVHNLRQSTARLDVYDVAEGFLGLKIQRIIPKDPNQPSYILKKYRKSYGTIKKDKELRGLEYLRKLKQDGTLDTFHIVGVLQNDPKRMSVKLEDIRGRGLDLVLKDMRIPADLRQRLLEDYERKLAVLEQAIARAEPSGSLRLSKKPHGGANIFQATKADGSDPTFMITISTAQIVVTFDPEDPNKFTLSLVDST